MTVVPLSEALVLHVAENMRASDRAEIAAMSAGGVLNPAELAAHCAASRWGGVVMHDGQPAVAMGGIEAWPGTASVWMFATDAWSRCWRTAVRWMRDTLAAVARRDGVTCFFVFAIEGRPEVERMLRGVGFKRRGIVPYFGAGGEAFAVWSRAGSAR